MTTTTVSSFAAVPAPHVVALKLQVVRGDAVTDCRRVRLGAPTFEALLRTVEERVRGTYTLMYTDDEGDVISIGSEQEWAECLDIMQQAACVTLQVHPVATYKPATAPVRMQLAPKAAPSPACANPSKSMRKPMVDQCANCDFAVTGVAKGHCCHACKNGKGKHGKKCARMAFEAAPAVAEPIAEKDAAATEKCSKCDFAVTGVAKGHCCHACKNGKGKHGKKCARMTLEDLMSA